MNYTFMWVVVWKEKALRHYSPVAPPSPAQPWLSPSSDWELTTSVLVIDSTKFRQFPYVNELWLLILLHHPASSFLPSSTLDI